MSTVANEVLLNSIKSFPLNMQPLRESEFGVSIASFETRTQRIKVVCAVTAQSSVQRVDTSPRIFLCDFWSERTYSSQRYHKDQCYKCILIKWALRNYDSMINSCSKAHRILNCIFAKHGSDDACQCEDSVPLLLQFCENIVIHL